MDKKMKMIEKEVKLDMLRTLAGDLHDMMVSVRALVDVCISGGVSGEELFESLAEIVNRTATVVFHSKAKYTIPAKSSPTNEEITGEMVAFEEVAKLTEIISNSTTMQMLLVSDDELTQEEMENTFATLLMEIQDLCNETCEILIRANEETEEELASLQA